MNLDTAAFVFRVLVGIILIGIIIYGIIKDNRKKKPILISSRGRGTVDKNGIVTDFTLDGYEIIDPK